MDAVENKEYKGEEGAEEEGKITGGEKARVGHVEPLGKEKRGVHRVVKLMNELFGLICPNEGNDLTRLRSEREKLEMLVDHVDVCLGRVDSSLSLIKGKRENDHGYGNVAIGAVGVVKAKKEIRPTQEASLNVDKPQENFRVKVDNSMTPFVPIIRKKPNAITPLLDYGAIIEKFKGLDASCWPKIPHPYKDEIESLQLTGNTRGLIEETLFYPVEKTKLSYIDDVEDLAVLGKLLESVTEFAVDLEHHDFRTFQGLTCLMQISTRSEDFIIDTLELRDEISDLLLPAFSNPKIVKVLHGAERDIIWLQRDLGLYVVNMFDTGQAARALELTRFGLKHLLKEFCDVEVDKKYQLADWRQRPIPSEMINYARRDTHYLLYIYDRLRNLLVEKSEISSSTAAASWLMTVWRSSNAISLSVYEKDLPTEAVMRAFCQENGLFFHPIQFNVFRAVYLWRDKKCRDLDESYRCFMPNRILIQICTALPDNLSYLKKNCTPIPPLLFPHIAELLEIVYAAKKNTQTAVIPDLEPVVATDVQVPSTISAAFDQVGWTSARFKPLLSAGSSASANAIAYSSAIPIDPVHVVISSSDLNLREDQKRLLDNFDPAGFTMDCSIIAKHENLKSCNPSSVVFGPVLNENVNENLVVSVRNSISMSSIYQLLGPADLDYSHPEFIEEKGNSNDLAAFENYDFASTLPSKKQRLNEHGNVISVESSEAVNSFMHDETMDIAKFSASIGWGKAIAPQNVSSNVTFEPFDYKTAAQSAAFNQPKEAAATFHPYVEKEATTPRVSKPRGLTKRDVAKQNQKSATFVSKN